MFTSFASLLQKIPPTWLTPPIHCLLCLTTIPKGKIALCDDCRADLPVINQGCQHCNLPLPYDGICGQCLQKTPVFFQAITPYRYDFPIAQLITLFKHHKQWPTGYLLSQLLSQHLSYRYQQGLKKPDYLISVPLAGQRLRERSFNQTEMMVKWLAKELKLDYQTNLIKRITNTFPQQQLSAKERAKNLANAFTIDPKIKLTNHHIAIVDDVITTGTTANKLAELLYQQGAKRVDIYAIARTPQRIK
ncbi:amidophosphoribosyltransferase [Gammaproteobacteria bacterium ESL0073]|nr:amidophosphoribosyltransferase [Gammaproteobacteria bacterium ESL0073]